MCKEGCNPDFSDIGHTRMTQIFSKGTKCTFAKYLRRFANTGNSRN